MNTFDFTLDFFRFLHKCSLYHIRLRSIKVYEDRQTIRFHFAKQIFLGNNTYSFDDDYYIDINYDLIDNEYALYEKTIESVNKYYKIK